MRLFADYVIYYLTKIDSTIRQAVAAMHANGRQRVRRLLPHIIRSVRKAAAESLATRASRAVYRGFAGVLLLKSAELSQPSSIDMKGGTPFAHPGDTRFAKADVLIPVDKGAGHD
jgi:hypothetical protein